MGIEQPAATQIPAVSILGRFASLRASLRERIQEVDRMSQREIIHVADDVNTIYQIATSQIESLKSYLSERINQDSKSKISSADAQLSAVDKSIKKINQQISDFSEMVSQSTTVTWQVKKAAKELEEIASDVERATKQSSGSNIENPENPSAEAADSMQSLKRICDSLSSTSSTIQRLAGTLGLLMPLLERGVDELSNLVQTHSRTLSENLSSLAMQDLALRNGVAYALETSDLALGTIVKSSQSALSHMQFQDAISQGLMRLDAIAHENEVALCREVGLEDRIAGLAPVMHVELGGDKAVEQKNAGKVVLF